MMNGDNWRRMVRHKTRLAVAAERRRWIIWTFRAVAAAAIASGTAAVIAWALK